MAAMTGGLIAAPALAQQATVADGMLRGTAVAGPAPVTAFLGIPYAAPPVDPLRWTPPQPVARWQGVRAADRFGPRCMQQPLYADMMFRSPAPSEDCLTLNVWMPAGTPRGAKLPVLFYIHGGGAIAGDGSEKRYDGASMARRGMVVVTINYRLGVFGFLATPELAAESPQHAAGNYGLLDQAAALDWVRRNVETFGGDPGRITIAGESAGSMSVSVLMTSPLTRTHFARAIGESGGVLPPTFHPKPLAEAAQAGTAFAQAAGAPTLAALRAMPAEQLLAAQGRQKFRADFILDGLFLTETPAASYAAGRAAKVPLLVGSNSQEGAWTSILGDAAPTVMNYRTALERLFPGRGTSLFALYPAASDADVPATAMRLASDRFLGASTWQWFDLHRRSGEPTYYYHYAHVRPAARPPLTNDTPAPLGAVHSAEIEYALGNLDANPLYAWTNEDRSISSTMQGYFTAFVKAGDPNAAGFPRWNAAGANGDTATRQVIDVNTRSEPFGFQASYPKAVTLLDGSLR
ncbi:carboxylesterase family protein [Sphingomonas sp. PB2P19]|uniref:carboxylesterase/lipase family protein n=1 Tax=Sphingomonas rhamnosi TaxID=3096156 RepID=UPI002FC691B1